MRCKPPKSVCTADRQRNLNLARQGQALRVLRSLDVIPAWWVGQDLQAAKQPKSNSQRLRVKVGHYEKRSCSRNILLGYSPISLLKSIQKASILSCPALRAAQAMRAGARMGLQPRMCSMEKISNRSQVPSS
jgi:hypothetical protein